MSGNMFASRFAVLRDEGNEDTIVASNDMSQQKTKSKKSKRTKKKRATDSTLTISDEINTEIWRKIDEQTVDNEYEKDLEEALILSKLQYDEERLQPVEEVHRGNSIVDENSSKAVKSKTRNKNRERAGKGTTLSLEEFQHLGMDGDTHSNHVKTSDIVQPVPEKETLFQDAHTNARRILIREKEKEQYDRFHKVEAVIKSRYEEKMEEKDKIIDSKDAEISNLRQTLASMQIQLQDHKQTIRRLKHLLSEGEMRDRAEVLVQVEQLTQIRDNLTSQLTEATEEVERERSRSHQLKNELEKKTARHGGAGK